MPPRKAAKAPKAMATSTTRNSTLADAIAGDMTVDAFGVLIENTQVPLRSTGLHHPAGNTNDLHLARIVGFRDSTGCHALGRPVIYTMPEPDGPANACGWNKPKFVVWNNVPKTWLTLDLSPKQVSFHSSLVARVASPLASNILTAAQSLQVIGDCIFQTTGSSAPLQLSNSLQNYGFDTQDQVDTLVGFISGNASFGVRRFNFTIDPSLFGGVTTGSTLADLDSIIRNNATPE
jgi:hypothetical protein